VEQRNNTLKNDITFYRDLKPENILLMSKESDTDIKLCDFGFAKHLTLGNQSASDVAGTLAYLAPEILEGLPYGNKVGTYAPFLLEFHICADGGGELATGQAIL
jgi:serine/threonine protein kinase